MKKGYIVSIDLGGTKILTALVNSKDGVIERVKKSTKIGDSKNKLPKVLYESVKELLEKTNIPETAIRAICVGAPGSVDPNTGIISLAPNLGLVNYHLKDELQKFTTIPVLLENDVNLAAIGINGFDVAKGFSNVLVVFVGTGIGGGLIMNGKIYRGSHFIAGEIGHIPVEDKGIACGCGNHGCFETVASRSAIVRDIVKDIRAGKRSKLTKYVKSKTQIKSKALANALLEDDAVTWRHVKKASAMIGRTLAGINNLLNLEMIVLGGGVIEAMKKQTVPLIKASFKEYSFKEASRHTKVVVSKLLDDAALYGGIGLAKEFLDVDV